MSQRAIQAEMDLYGVNMLLMDATEGESFNPYTHIISNCTGIPKDDMRKIVKKMNNSMYLETVVVSFDPVTMAKLGFRGTFKEFVRVKLTGGEGKTAYIYHLEPAEYSTDGSRQFMLDATMDDTVDNRLVWVDNTLYRGILESMNQVELERLIDSRIREFQMASRPLRACRR
jgi:hypothetical protein